MDQPTPAFPITNNVTGSTGLTKREYFAVRASQEDIVAAESEVAILFPEMVPTRSFLRFYHADKMIEESQRSEA